MLELANKFFIIVRNNLERKILVIFYKIGCKSFFLNLDYIY
jgi:hypothetical protein